MNGYTTADYERFVLSAIMKEGHNAFYAVYPQILNSDSFEDPKHQIIFEAMADLVRQSLTPDVMQIAKWLKANKKKIGIEFLADIDGYTYTSAGVTDKACVVAEAAMRRKAVEALQAAIKDVTDESTDPFETIAQTASKVLKILPDEKASIRSASTLASDTGKEIFERQSGKSEYIYQTGLAEVDRLALIARGRLIVIGGRPGMGKTALAVDLIRRMANRGRASIYFSYEMSGEELMLRMISAETGLPYTFMSRKDGLTGNTWKDKIIAASGVLAKLPIQISDESATIDALAATVRRQHQKGKVDVVFVDYLQLVPVDSAQSKNKNKPEVIGMISRVLKVLANELQIAVVLLSQLSRETDKRADKRPTLADLSWSDEVVQNADVVVFPFRPNYYDDAQDSRLVELIVGKNRSGGVVGSVDLHADLGTNKFGNLGEIDKKDLPF
jgi:replicative DNA helicase